jgi:DNA-binding response OmpR family regulator
MVGFPNPSQADLRARLLVVDDEPGVRVSMAEFFKLRGYHVGAANSGHEALAMLESDSYDLMILDMVMPGMNGVEVMRRARQMRPDLLIVVLTAHANLESAITAVKANVTDYMLKPCGLDDLALTISRALQGRAREMRRQQLLDTVGVAMDALRQEGTAALPCAPSPLPAPESAGHLLRVGPLTLDRQKRLASLDGDPARTVELTEGEVAILVALMEHPNQVFSCNQLADAAAGYGGLDKWTVENIVRSSVFRLRQKIESAPDQPSLIRTVRGRGYFLALA